MSSLRPVSGDAAGVLALLREWDAARSDPGPVTVATSGSTGEPKRVLLPRAALRASADAAHARLGGPGQWVLNLPPTYVAGVQVLVRSVRAGTEPVLQRGTLAGAVAGMSADRRYLSVVPTQLHRLLGDPAETAALAGLSAVLVGGAAMPGDLRARAEAAGVRVVATYGMSETCGGCVYDGVPLDGVAVALAADGRVRLAGPVLFAGYEDRPDLTDAVLRHGWFHTQDLGRLDEDGRLQVLGRADDVVISGGVNIAAPAVAERLREHPRVLDAAVVGVPDPEWGQRVVAVVVGDLTLAEARDWVAEALPRAWAPRGLRTLAELPLLGNGKPDRLRIEQVAGG